MSCQGPTIVRSCAGLRVVSRNTGPPGPPGPPGEDGDVTGPNASLDGEVVVFNGVTGKVIKRSNILLSALATVAALANKVDKETGKGLSANDFTNAYKAILDNIIAGNGGNFVGTYPDAVSLAAAQPGPPEGSFAYVVTLGFPQILYIWDEVNTQWVPVADPTGAEIKALLFNEPDTNNLSDARLALLTSAVQQTTFDAAIATLQAQLGVALDNSVNEPNSSRSLILSDSGKYLRLTSGSGCTIDLPAQSGMPWTLSVEIYFRIATAGPVTLVPAGAVTVNGIANLAALGLDDNFLIKRVAIDEWDLIVGK